MRRTFGPLRFGCFLLVVVCICVVVSGAAQAGKDAKRHAVPAESGLRGVVVEDKVVDVPPQGPFEVPTGPTVATRAYTLKRVVITALDRNSPAAAAGLKNGDVIADVLLPGDDFNGGPEIAMSEFYSKAGRCVPDCVVIVLHEIGKDSSHPERLFAVLVGTPGHNFVYEWNDPLRRYILRSLRTGNVYLTDLVPTVPVGISYVVKEGPTAAGDSAASKPQAGEVSQEDEIRRRIASIKASPHEAAPTPQANKPASGTGVAALTVENRTEYLLYVYLSGPTAQQFKIAAHASQVVYVAPGSYEVAGIVSDPGVIPFYGIQGYDPGGGYSEVFYIARH